MFASVALAFFATTAAPEASAPVAQAPAAPAVKPRKICRSEAVIGSITPKRVCTVVPPRSPAPGQGSGQASDRDQQRDPQQNAGTSN